MRAIPSRFLAEIPEHLTTGSRASARTRSGYERESYRRVTSWDSTPGPQVRQREPERANRYHSGQRVHHATFGEGVVIASKVRGDDEEVDVKFATQKGIKRLSANIANLVSLADE